MSLSPFEGSDGSFLFKIQCALLDRPTFFDLLEDIVGSGIVLARLGFEAYADFYLRFHPGESAHQIRYFVRKALDLSDIQRDRVGEFAAGRDWRRLNDHRLALPDH